ncbi:MAG: hypothetical protein O2890_08840 [Cyanobacteria bacterium]|nr:hypothetical protein [Cyanobacteriota bacterium]MDA0866514.1 hypothetical protein [Cyanobacteriota bacterium]
MVRAIWRWISALYSEVGQTMGDRYGRITDGARGLGGIPGCLTQGLCCRAADAARDMRGAAVPMYGNG